jgi:putative ABC transport system ATP-binding protein
MYELERVSKTYRQGGRPVQALIDVDLTIADGEFVAVQGQTGGGKSTLLQLLGALDKPSSGTIRLDGADLGRMGASELTRVRANRIGFVFQSFNLIPTLTAQENVETALAPTHIDARDRRNRAEAALEAVSSSASRSPARS